MMMDVLGFPIDLAAPCDIDFVRGYGRPFWVAARPETGLLCVGVDSPRHGRLLIRYAGAALAGDALPPEQAVRRLREAMPAYESLYGHPALISLQGHGPAAAGYAAIFRWPEGEPFSRPDVRKRLLYQPLLSRLRMIDPVIDLYACAWDRGWQALGFGEEALRIDLTTGQAAVCDIDLYRPRPVVNGQGRMPGSLRYLSPEEYLPGAALDDVTMEYAMGALAFAFFSAGGSRERADWMAGEAHYRAAARACSEKREKRYPTLRDFQAAWRAAAGNAAEG